MAIYNLDENWNLVKEDNSKKKKKKSKTYNLDSKWNLVESKEDIAPVTTTQKKDSVLDGYFKSGEGNVAEKILGSGTDLAQNITQGLAQIPELAGKGLLAIAPAFDMAQKSSLGVTITDQDWEIRRQQEEEVDKVIKKDWYDEKKVANKILSGVATASYLNNSTMTGGLTPKELEKTLEIQKQALDYIQNDAEKSSVFDYKSDALAVSGGQLLGTVGLQAVGVPWWVTTGSTTLGGEVENALNSGATHDEAVFSGLVTAGGEILSEKLTGGINFGGKTLTGELLDDSVSRLLSQSISNKLGRSLLKVGIDASGEGFEEVFSDLASKLGQKLSYEDEKTWAELFASEEAMESYIDSFIGGFVLGGISSGSSAIKSNANGVDFVTENTTNEQKVVDAEVNSRIEAQEKENGKKLTLSEKTKIRKQVHNEMERGELSTDTIESILGGETYEAYKSSTDEINSLKSQYATLQEQAKDPRPSIQNQAKAKLSEVEAKLREVEEKFANTNLKDQLSNEVYELTKNEKLGESYREVARRGQVFEADLTQYDEKTKATVQKAIDSGILNNTRKTHDFVDLIAKLSAEKGVSFDFANNESLKNSGFAIEGKTINGLVHNGEVILNIDSKKALNTVVGHEITHVLEGTELYSELQSSIIEYAKSKGDYDARLKALQETYKDVKEANIENELTADLVGDYLFTDENFVRNLSAEKPSLFKKIYEEIKYLYKMATAGSKEARELEKVKRAFDKAFKESSNVNDKKTSYSLELDVKAEVSSFGIENKMNDYIGVQKEVIPKLESEGYFGEVTNEETGMVIDITKKGIKETLGSGKRFQVLPRDLKELKLATIRKLPQILKEAHLIEDNVKNIHGESSEFAYFEIETDINGVPLRISLDVKRTSAKNKFWIHYIDITKENSQLLSSGKNQNINEIESSPKEIIADNSKNASEIAKYSLSEDSEGAKLSKEQQEFYKDVSPLLKDNQGRLMVLYHQTDAEFTKFDTRHKGAGSFDHETPYGVFLKPTSSDIGIRGQKQMPLYALIKNPLQVRSRVELVHNVSQDREYYNLYMKQKDVDKEYSNKFEEAKNEFRDYISEWRKNNPNASRMAIYEDEGFKKIESNEEKVIEEWESKSNEVRVKAKERLTEYLKENGYDGLIIEEDVGSFGRSTKTIIAFEPNQIKSVDNTAPTEDADIRFSLGEQTAPNGNYNVYGKDIALESALAPTEQVREATKKIDHIGETTEIVDAPTVTQEMFAEDVAPNPKLYMTIKNESKKAQEHISIESEPTKEPRMVRVKEGETEPKPRVNQRRWVDTSTQSDVVNREILPDDLDVEKITYTPIPNKVTLKNANTKLGVLGYDDALTYFNSQLANKRATLDDIALGERLLQEAMKKSDKATAGELIQNISILGTELGQKVQALSIIQRLTPEGQLKMLYKTINRGKIKGDKAFEGVEITQELIDHILKTYKADGTFDHNELNKAVEDVKTEIAKQMKVTAMDKVNAWRYLSMLGNPKTHIRNLVSNVAMKGIVAVKNAVARSIETIAPINERTKIWKRASDEVKYFAETTTKEMKDVITGDAKYSEDASIKAKREIFKNKVLESVYQFNSELLSKEDWWFSKSAYKNSLSEYLTANGIRTRAEIDAKPEIVEKAKQYALEQSEIATFRQYSWLANQIRAIENKNTATQIAVGSILPFKKTPVNIAKAGLSYSPLGFAKSLTYDMYQMKKGNMQASQVVDNLAQGLTGSALALVGYMLAMSGVLNGGGDDDKEGKYDYQLGKQSYSLNFGGSTYSLSWLSPVAMPLFVGANAYEQLVEGEEWNGDVVMETLAQTLDPLSEMSFLSSLDSVLSSYDSGVEKFAGIGEAMLQNYATQFIPTLSSQVATVLDDTKRSTKVAGDSKWRIVDETINKLKYKVPFLRETLEPSTDIWGNEIKQSENMIERALETFIAPYSRKESISTEIDAEIKDLYAQTGDNGIIPSVPYNYVNYDGEKYKMSAKEYTKFKKAYGQTANEMLEDLFNTTTYQNANSEDRAELVNKVYDYARDEAKREYLLKEGVEYTNATQDGEEYYKENNIKGAIDNDMTLEEFDLFAKNPSKFYIAKTVGGYGTYKSVTSELGEIYADKDEDGKSISGSAKRKKTEYINSLDLDYGQKIILYRSLYDSKADKEAYNMEIVEYLNSREDISYEEMKTILEELDFKVHDDGTITW